MTIIKQKKKPKKQSKNGERKDTMMCSLNYDHEIECKGNSNCTCNEIIDAKWQAMKDAQWNS